MGIRFLRLPRNLNIDRMIYDKVTEIYGVCPYCGDNKNVLITALHCMDRDEEQYFKLCENYYVKTYDLKYGTLEKGPECELNTFNFRKKYDEKGNRYFVWARKNFNCQKCGCVWQSEHYPMGLSQDPDIINDIMNKYIADNSAMISIGHDLRLGLREERR